MTEEKNSQTVFDEIKTFSKEQLTHLVMRSLAHVEKTCTEFLSDSAGDADEKSAVDLARQHIFNFRKELLQHIIDSFTQMLIGEKEVGEDGKNSLTLSLVDDEMLDEMIVIGELTGRIQDYYDLHIKTLKRGMVRLSKEMEFEPEPEAFTPKKLLLVLRESLSDSELKLASKRYIYKPFTDAIQAELKPLYDGVLGLLQESEIITEAENPSSENFKIVFQYRQQQAVRQAKSEPGDAGDPNAMAQTAMSAAPPAAALAPAGLAPVAAQAINPSMFQGSATSEAVYGFLSRQHQPQVDAGGVALPTVDSGDLVKLLSNLQNLSTISLAQSALKDSSSISEHINEAITSKTSEWAKQLSGPEANVIELVNSMFTTIIEDPDLIDPVKVQIGRLQIPYIKVALLDVTLLNQTAHPARLLLNELAQQGIRINSANNPLMKIIANISQNIIDGFESDLSVFTINLTKLRQETENQAKEIEKVEEETVGKAESQAELLHIKKHIVIRLRQFLKGKILPKEVHSLLLKGFAPLLLKIYRNEGEDSANWDKTVFLLRQTVESVQPRNSIFQLESVLNQSSVIIGEVQKALKELPKKFMDAGIIEGLKATYEQLSKKLGHLETTHAEEDEEAKYDPLALDTEYEFEPDPALLNQPTPEELLAQLPEQLHAGAWCEVYMGRNEPSQKLKVSSILRESAQLVFVDNTGSKSEIKDIQDFLDELDCERSKILQDEQLFDKALTAVINNMNLMRAVS